MVSHAGWVEPTIAATVFFSPTWCIEALAVRFYQNETEHMPGMLGKQRVLHLLIREMQVKGRRPRVVVAAVCWVSLCLFRLLSMAAFIISGEVPNSEASIRSTQPTIKPRRKPAPDLNANFTPHLK